MRKSIVLVLLAAALAAADDLLPRAPDGTVELHGVWSGERFWMRLNPPNPEFGNQRMVELVYSPPPPQRIAGAHLPDTPFLLLDDRLRLVAWNGRDTLSRAVADLRGYTVTREVEARTDDGKDAAPAAEERRVAGARGWDERLAPALLVLAWRAGTRGEVPAYDLFGPAPLPSAASWRDRQVMIAGRPYRATADAAGRLARLDDAAGGPVLSVTAWITP